MSKESSGLFNGTSGSSNRKPNEIESVSKSGKTQAEIQSVANMVIPNLPANPNTLITNGWKDTTPAPMKEKLIQLNFMTQSQGLI